MQMKALLVTLGRLVLGINFGGLSLAAEPIPEGKLIRPGQPDFAALILERPMISKLSDGESVTLTITTRGCFGGSRYALQFVGPPPIRVTVHGGNRPDAEDPLPIVGQVVLSEIDARKVDRTIAYYRSGPGGGCTTASGITAEWRLRSGTRSESWEDASCACWLRPDSVVTRLY